MLLSGMVLLVAGMWSIAIFPIYAVAVIGIFLGGLAKSVFDPALQAYIGERVDFRRRGRVIGLVEMSWAGATSASGTPAAAFPATAGLFA